MNISLTREESSAMKGIAMLCIVLHNLLHLVGPLVKENEFFFNYSRRSYYMWDHIENLHANLLADVLSYFGWYGVPVFIFLSGYGITRKYEHPMADGSWMIFLGHNIKKLWLLFIFPFLVYVILSICLWGKTFELFPLLAQITFTINFLCDPRYIDPGVYWYFGVTLQLYLVYRIFLYGKSLLRLNLIAVTLILISLILSRCLMPDSYLKIQPEYEYFSHNCIRWLYIFLFGAILARLNNDGRSHWYISLFIGLLSLGLLVLSGINRDLWLLSPVVAVIFFMAIVKLIHYAPLLEKLCIWLGSLSAFIFVTHPVVRPFFAGHIVKEGQLVMDGHSWMLVGLYLFVVILVAWLYRCFFTRYFRLLCERIINAGLKRLFFKKN